MKKHYHLIGIGGIGMSGIAQLLLSRGESVSGSDIKESKIIERLRSRGAKIFLGHEPANIKGADLVIYSSAISEDNPEMAAAKRQGIPLVKRAQALAELMKEKSVIAVTGSHGKTTTASLISYLLLEAGFSPTVAIGGIHKNIDTNACPGEGDFFVAEADESDGSFLFYRPKYSILTNIDYEHLDYYKNFQNALNAYKQFLNRTENDGCLFCCADDINLKSILKDYKNRYILFGLKESADIRPQNIQMNGLSSSFDCFFKGEFICRFELALGGEHNISNALAAVALGLELKIDLAVIKKILKNYRGTERRLEIKFKDKKYLLIDDYAHHPTEIKATLAALRNLKFNRLIAVFQPHRYSRTQLLLDEFGNSFALADVALITDIYPAQEAPIEGINGMRVCEKIKEHSPNKEVKFLPKQDIIPYIAKIIKPGDLLVTLGAGDITKISDELAEELKRKD